LTKVITKDYDFNITYYFEDVYLK